MDTKGVCCCTHADICGSSHVIDSFGFSNADMPPCTITKSDMIRLWSCTAALSFRAMSWANELVKRLSGSSGVRTALGPPGNKVARLPRILWPVYLRQVLQLLQKLHQRAGWFLSIGSMQSHDNYVEQKRQAPLHLQKSKKQAGFPWWFAAWEISWENWKATSPLWIQLGHSQCID